MFKSLLQKAQKREEGQGLVEYALILVLVAVVVIVVLSQVGPGVGNIFSQVVGALNGEAVADAPSTGCHSNGVYFYQFNGGYMVPAGTRGFTDATCSTAAVDHSISGGMQIYAPAGYDALELCNRHGSFTSLYTGLSNDVYACVS